MPGENTKIPQLKPCYFWGKLDNHIEKFVEVVHRLSINMPLLDALLVPTYSRYFKDILVLGVSENSEGIPEHRSTGT
jgi:hypothetical protein